MGCGFYNPHSLIAIRLVSRKKGEAQSESFWTGKILRALRLRAKIYGPSTAAKNTYRAVFGESDGLPGLIIDRYENTWVMQFHALGMYQRKQELQNALLAALTAMGDSAPAAIVARTDVRSGKLEGLTTENTVAFGEIPAAGVFAWEGDLQFPVDVVDGQKTGFFFDQRENRRVWANWLAANGADEIADVYCHLGAWGLMGLAAGAKHAVFIDQSEKVLETVKEIAAKHGWQGRVECISGDAEKILARLQSKRFSAMALDPPAFIQNRKGVATGMRAYRQINQAGIRLLAEGAALSTSTCSHHCTEASFEAVVAQALVEKERTAQLVYRGFAAFDHPALAGVPESRYLKNLLLRVN